MKHSSLPSSNTRILLDFSAAALKKTKKYSSTSTCLIKTWIFSSLFSVVAVTDSISQGRVVTRSETIVSAGKVFELGFFSIGNSSNYYVGIWYKQISVKTIVWVANRDLPLTSSSPALTINNEGNLVIVDGRITYEVNDNALSQNTSAILLDSGNFVLRNAHFDVLWQSFDYPSDTLLPGMKFGYSTRNKKLWSIRSWRDVDDPEVGAAELKMDPKRPKELFLIRNSVLAWQSDGAWREGRFNLMPEMISNYTFNYSFYTNENETFFIYFLYNSSIPSRFLIDVSGQLKQLLWLEKNQIWGLFWAQPRYECDIYSYCGPFSSCSNYTESFCQCLNGFIPSENLKQKDQSGGCVRRIPLRCEDSSDNSGEDRFLRIDEVKFPLSPKTSKVYAAEDCKLACFNTCSCNAYAYNGSGACYLWDAELLNLEQLSDGHPDGQTIYLKLAASEFLNPGGNKQLIWIVAVVVSLAVLLPASYIFCRWRAKRKAKEEIEISQDMLLFDMNMSVETSTSELSIGDGAGKGKSKDSWFPLFSLASVSAATDNFSAENKLGEGGFGPVYKGKLLNGQEVAVKRLSRQSGQGLEELKNETMLIAKLQHRNLVRLLGCCMEHGEKILIYEYMPNKSLDSFLFDPIKKGLLDWGTRVKIIEGIAQGVLYLHQYSRLRIIHRDLKASNILLDSFMNPKISDFGMARMFGGDELQASTNRIVGTYGYMSPEYALEGLFSIKSDVFSFGVLLLETLSGRKNTGFYNTESLNLLGHAWKLWKDNKAIDLLDPILKDEASYPMLMRCINIAFLCVEENAGDRPTMSEVVSMLTNELAVLPSPKQLAFSFLRMQNSNPHQERPEICSLNNITVSLMEAR